MRATRMIRSLGTVIDRLTRRGRSEEQGIALVLAGLGMMSFLAMAALSLDIGMFMEARRQTQNAADAAAHAAAQEMPDLAAAQAAADLYWTLNEPSLGASTLNVSFPTNQSVRVEAYNAVPFFFAPVFGVLSGDVEVAAQVGADGQPADVVIAVDTSGSMCRDSHGLMLTCPNVPNLQPWTQVQEATLAFPDYLLTHTDDWLGLVSYSTEANREMPMSQGYASFPAKVGNLHPDGYTNIGHAIQESTDVATQGRPNVSTLKIIVLVTDGVPNVYPGGGGSWTTCSGTCAATQNYGRDMAEAAAAQGIQLYTIGLGATVDSDYLTELAELANGAYVESPTAADLEAAFAEVARKARISFTE